MSALRTQGGRSGGGPAGKRSDLSLRPGLSVEARSHADSFVVLWLLCCIELAPVSSNLGIGMPDGTVACRFA